MLTLLLGIILGYFINHYKNQLLAIFKKKIQKVDTEINKMAND